ncbi:hypothetical protein H0H93_004834 [Arthromyces matolae]|nr:hypothetical protein H0H93_004834 [Arthromyces matolae]
MSIINPGQGSKICPQADVETLMTPHTSATHKAIAERLANDCSSRLELLSPEYNAFCKTAALIATVCKLGCEAPEYKPTELSQSEQVHYDDTQALIQKVQCGYVSQAVRCKGRIVFEVQKWSHWLTYNLDYIKAHFHKDADELDRIEHAAFVSGFGPLAECSTVSNYSLQRVCCQLADLTSCRFLRHPLTKNYLRDCLPDISSPLLSDLHVLLANREHLAYLIEQSKKKLYPVGTGWEGVKRYKELEDTTLAPKDIYIRKIIELPAASFPTYAEDEPVKAGQDNKVQMVICMSKEGSRRLTNAQYLQSDIGFKRVVGFYKFELACLDRDANTSTAAAHQRMFHEIDAIVKADTGQGLCWRHLYQR